MIVTKPKTCRMCKSSFTPARPLARVCSPMCALDFARSTNERKARKEQAQDKRETRAKLVKFKTIPQLKKEAQHAFNAYIRARDFSRPCICCGQALGLEAIGGGYDCGHYRSTGSADHLRFHEDNAHAQRKHCNRYGAGRAVDYRLGLIARIGLERVERLESDNSPMKWTREVLKEIKALYVAKAKALREGMAQ